MKSKNYLLMGVLIMLIAAPGLSAITQSSKTQVKNEKKDITYLPFLASFGYLIPGIGAPLSTLIFLGSEIYIIYEEWCNKDQLSSQH